MRVATAALELITGPLLTVPRRLGKPLRDELVGVFVARFGREWRVLYEVDEDLRRVTVLDIQHRRTAYQAYWSPRTAAPGRTRLFTYAVAPWAGP